MKKFIFCFKSTSNINSEEPIFTLYGSGEAYDGDYYESSFASSRPGLAAEKEDGTYLLCYPGMYTSDGWDLLKSIGGDSFNPVFGTTRISPQPTGPDTSETYWDRTFAGDSDKKPQVKIMDGIEFVVICPSTGMFRDILPYINGFYTRDILTDVDMELLGATAAWTNQRRSARILQMNDKFYFYEYSGLIELLVSEGNPSSPVCSYQTMDGTKIDSSAMQVKFAYEAFGG